MMNIQTIIILAILHCISSFDCNLNNKQCACIKSQEYEFQCPSIYSVNYLIHAKPDAYVNIDCENLTSYDVNALPAFDAGQIEDFRLRRCPLNYSDLRFTWDRFNITKVKLLKLEEIWMSDGTKIISKDLFRDLGTLQQLQVSMLDSRLDDDFLYSLSNLERLYLEDNQIESLSYNFNYTTKLKVLHLSRNRITNIPDGAFALLTDLKQLHLWRNNLRKLNKSAFSGLKQLTSLELSRNKLEVLDDDVFSEMTKLVNISLLQNNLGSLSEQLFQHNINLEGIKIGYNPRLVIPDKLFANLSKLIDVNIDSSNLEVIPPKTFIGCDNLKRLSLVHNKLQEISKETFASLRNLRWLDLSSNKFEQFSNKEKPFSHLQELEYLNLKRNQLTELSDRIFAGLVKLKTLILSENKIKLIDNYSFADQAALLTLDLSHNQYSMQYQETFTFIKQLEQLRLGHNLIKSFPDRIIYNNLHLKMLDLTHNRIQTVHVNEFVQTSNPPEIDLSYNNITNVDFTIIKLHEFVEQLNNYKGTPANIDLSGNSFICNCDIYDLVRYANGELDFIKHMLNLKLSEARCSQPQGLADTSIINLTPTQVMCEDTFDCPTNCSCEYRPFDTMFVIDCSYRQLKSYPILYSNRSRIEMNLVGNLLEYGPTESVGYENVVNLFLSDNSIENFDWIPPKIEMLILTGNQLSAIKTSTIGSLSKARNLKKLDLSENPWNCDCAALPLQNFLRTKYKAVNITSIRCKKDNKLLLDIQQLCISPAIIAGTIVAIIMIILLILFILYLKYKQFIKVWLFSKNLCLCCVSEEELDKDKEYDIFISFAHQDEDFVLKKLLPILESGPQPFKVCIHMRDWIPGEMILTHVNNSVLNSRRTLVVLSNDFLESVWGKLEFRTAHVTAIKDNCPRVIVLKYGALDEKKLDDDFKTYLKTNTYVEWDTPWFWEKLLYALPHKRTEKNAVGGGGSAGGGGGYQESLRHANIMLKIDDKFELSSVPVCDPESTPPVLSELKGDTATKLKVDNIGLSFNASESPLINNRIEDIC